MKHFGYHLLAVITVIIWGTTFVSTKVLLQHGMQPMEIYLLRFIVAYLCIWTISPRKIRSNSWKDEMRFLVLGIVGGSAYFVTENTALGLTYANNVSFLVCTAPLITTILAVIFVGHVKVSAPLIIGSFLAIFGMALVIYNGRFVLKLNPRGDLMALAACLCWAVYSLVIKGVSSRYSASFVTRKVFFYGIVTVLPMFAIQPWKFPLERLTNPVIGINMLYLTVLASFLCFLWWSISVQKLGALRTSNYVYLNPVSTVAASALFLDEPMTAIGYLGSILILSGVFLANMKPMDT